MSNTLNKRLLTAVAIGMVAVPIIIVGIPFTILAMRDIPAESPTATPAQAASRLEPISEVPSREHTTFFVTTRCGAVYEAYYELVGRESNDARIYHRRSLHMTRLGIAKRSPPSWKPSEWFRVYGGLKDEYVMSRASGIRSFRKDWDNLIIPDIDYCNEVYRDLKPAIDMLFTKPSD